MGGEELAQPQDDDMSEQKETPVTTSIRIPASLHRAIGEAAARADLSSNAWILQVAAAAVAVEEAAMLAARLDQWRIDDDGKMLGQLSLRVIDLLRLTLAHTDRQIAKTGDVLNKVEAALASYAGALEIHATRE